MAFSPTSTTTLEAWLELADEGGFDVPVWVREQAAEPTS
jgi:hypothetical protein